MNFYRLTSTKGTPVFINPDHIVGFHECAVNEDGDRVDQGAPGTPATRLNAVNGGVLVVKELPADVEHILTTGSPLPA